MISMTTRGLLLSLGLVLATAFSVRTAQAGGGLWTGTICMDPVTASEAFTGSFFGMDKCEALCKIAAGVCRGAVKNALSCQKTTEGGFVHAVGVVCTTLDGTDKMDCLDQFKSMKSDLKDMLEQDRTLGLANCDGYRDSCITGCTTPPL